jgi:hypothetical protein
VRGLPTPPPFTGEGNDSDPELTLMGLETFFQSTQISREVWGQHVQPFLKGAALRAYKVIALPLYQTSQMPPTWEQIRSMLLSFRKIDGPVVARSKLLSLHQTGSVSAFNTLFNSLLSQVGPDPPSGTDLLQAYLQGLKREIRHSTSPTGTPWDSLHAAQEFHLTKELAELSLRTRSDRPDRPSASKPPFTPRLKGAQATGNAYGSQGGRGGGGRSGGGRGPNGGYQGTKPKRPADSAGYRDHKQPNLGAPRTWGSGSIGGGGAAPAPRNAGGGASGSRTPILTLHDSAFGTTADACFKGRMKRCPKHPQAHHTKGECHSFDAWSKQFE